tara:strand:- start:127 stop:1026 length:900 start_codon:yes stop_codon:yes gene_type:complete
MLDTIDYTITKGIYDIFNRKYINKIPYFFGLIPYEFYVIPGMYLAILQIAWIGTPNPIQFHLLPHWFAYSIFQFLKKSIKKGRPGCVYKKLGKYIDESHCKHGNENQSFPSGHAGVSFSLATALLMEMNFSDLPHFFEIPITKQITKIIISAIGIMVATMVALHRVSMGYHSFFDVVIGAIIGFSIGFISWITLEYFKKSYNNLCKEKVNDVNNLNNLNNPNDTNDTNDLCKYYKMKREGKEFLYWMDDWKLFGYKFYNNSEFIKKGIGLSRLALTIPIIYLLYKFLTKDVFKLASIKH